MYEDFSFLDKGVGVEVITRKGIIHVTHIYCQPVGRITFSWLFYCKLPRGVPVKEFFNFCLYLVKICTRECNFAASGRGTGYSFPAISFFLSFFLCQQHYEKMAGPICMKFSGKVWSDHGTT